MAGSMVDSALKSVDKVQSYITIGMEDVIEVSLDLAENSTEGDETDAQLEKMKQVMDEYAHMEHDLSQYVKAVRKVKGQIQSVAIGDQANTDIDVDSLLEEALSDAHKQSNKELERHGKIVEMEERLWQYKNPGETVLQPSTNQQLEDGDVVMTQCDVTTKCPITTCEMTDPVTNRHCRHNYEKAAIMQILKNRDNAKCPVIGCGNHIPIVKSDLFDNRQLKKYIEQQKK